MMSEEGENPPHVAGGISGFTMMLYRFWFRDVFPSRNTSSAWFRLEKPDRYNTDRYDTDRETCIVV